MDLVVGITISYKAQGVNSELDGSLIRVLEQHGWFLKAAHYNLETKKRALCFKHNGKALGVKEIEEVINGYSKEAS